MKRKLLLITTLLGLGFCLSAQTITIVDADSREPIVGATLISADENNAISDVKGRVEISGFKNSGAITVRCLGYVNRVFNYEELLETSIIELYVDNLSLDEVVISGTRWRQASKDIPTKIISISAKEVELQNPQTAADLLGVSGKVFIQKSQQGGGSPMIRGFATNRLLYTVDGVRMNNAIFRGGNLQNVISLDPFAIEKTEVLFGPGSVIYGSDAVGGVMSFQTLTPKFSSTEETNFAAKAVTRYSSANNEKTGHLDFNLGAKKWAIASSFSYWDYDHLRQGKNGPDDYLKPFHVERIDGRDSNVIQSNKLLQIPTAYSQFNTLQKIRFKPNNKLDLQYGFHHSQTSNYGRYDRHNRLKNDAPRYGEWDYGPQTWTMHNISINYLAKNKIFDEMAFRLAFQDFKESRMSRDFQSEGRSLQAENVKAYSANLDFEKHLNKRNKLYYGFEYVLNDVTSSAEMENIETFEKAIGAARYPKSSWQSMAFYISEEYRANEKLTIQSGLRYNQFAIDALFDTTFYPFPFTQANISKGAITGSLGATYRPSASSVIKFGYGTAFRAPNVDDIGKIFDSEPGAVTVPNPNLEAEYAHNIDLGIAKVFSKTVKIDVTGYYTLLNNAIVRRDYQLNGQDSILYFGEMSKVQALQNAAQARVFGLQAGIEIKLPKGFSLSSDLNFQKGEEELDDGSLSPSRHAAPFFGATRLVYKKQKFNIQLNAVYQAERTHENLSIDEQGKDEIYAKDNNGLTFSPAWHTFNLKAQYVLNGNLSFNLGLENITNQRYRPYSSGVSAAGRNLVISVVGKI